MVELRDSHSFAALIAGARASVAALSDQLTVLERAVASPTPAKAADVARLLYGLRRARDRQLGRDLFGEPGWDMLLHLYIARAQGEPVSSSALCGGSAAPMTTALRWLGRLEKAKAIRRYPAMDDQRVILVEITTDMFGRLTDFFSGVVVAER